MGEAKHTAGPWWPCQDGDGKWVVKTYSGKCGNINEATHWINSVFICDSVGDQNAERTSGNEEANARLIAAAPELLEALIVAQKKLYVLARELPPLEVAKDRDFEFIRAVIAKTKAA